ncbi:uncharacterized protein MYCGRDRAFT_90801 [Zymoseptoria tritici IPO323]|uniref:Uncharacterized protein n=2 Tax=Zymoseptoria tritici TaxID=1047171 RepID=F9X3R5_ZYMTI|nr:uncharacterized protein MYCGRDRAFT_90801 [Zymoseptoria tritici IPO323]EGP90497.1 hypothetical protein MYCGRDRAFT_90801 [Zymoseptoria tritici IPO323]
MSTSMAATALSDQALITASPTLDMPAPRGSVGSLTAVPSDNKPISTIDGADSLITDGPDAPSGQVSSADGLPGSPNGSPSKGLSFEDKLGLGLGLGLGVPVVFALLAFLILYVRRRRRHRINQMQADLLPTRGLVCKVQSELPMVETPNARVSSVMPRSADGPKYEPVRVPFIGPRAGLSDDDFEDRENDHGHAVSSPTIVRPPVIPRKPINSIVAPIESIEGPIHDIAIDQPGGDRRSRASLGKLDIPSPPILGHARVSPVSPVSPVSSRDDAESSAGRGRRDVSPGV